MKEYLINQRLISIEGSVPYYSGICLVISEAYRFSDLEQSHSSIAVVKFQFKVKALFERLIA